MPPPRPPRRHPGPRPPWRPGPRPPLAFPYSWAAWYPTATSTSWPAETRPDPYGTRKNLHLGLGIGGAAGLVLGVLLAVALRAR